MNELSPVTLSGDTDDVRPWTIKSMPTEVRNLVVAAARDEGLTVSHWLERVIREAVGRGRSGAVVASGVGPADASALAGGVLVTVERAVAVAVALAAAPDVPAAFRRRANRLLREALATPQSVGRLG